MADGDLVTSLRQARVNRGDLVGLVISPALDLGLATADRSWSVAAGAGLADGVGQADETLRPRWAVWSGQTAARLIADGVRLATCWDITAAHRLLFGGWRADPGLAWARLRGLDTGTMPVDGPLDLFGMDEGDGSDPVAPDGHLRPEWVSGGWSDNPERMARWAALARTVAGLQQAALAGLNGPADGRSDGPLRVHRRTALRGAVRGRAADGPGGRGAGPGPHHRSPAAQRGRSGGAAGGPRCRGAAARAAGRHRRPAQPGPGAIAAGPGRHGRAGHPGLAAAGDAGRHPLVGALLEWRKAERIATTYGYAWLDEHLGADGRLRGEWTGSDGAAGRMTASAGLHNMPAALRPAVVAADGHVFVRADLGQIEPRVLAAVSGDPALAAAARSDDLYAPVAAQLGVDRPVAKVAVLGAMYGADHRPRRPGPAPPQRGLSGGDGLPRRRRPGRAGRPGPAHLRRSPDRAGACSRPGSPEQQPGRGLRPVRAKRDDPGRRGRAVQDVGGHRPGAVRALGARIVLCLHDELLVHSPREQAETVARLVDECLREAAQRWAPGGGVRFISDTSIVRSWSDAKSAALDPAGP